MTVDRLPSGCRPRHLWLLLLALMAWVGGQSHQLLASQSVELTWNLSPSPNIVAYRVYYGTQSGVYPNSVTFGDVSDVVVPGLSDGETYYFAVSAINANNFESALSSPIGYTTPAAAAIELTAQGSTSGLGAVSLSWTASVDSDVYGYAISYGTESGDYTNTLTYYYTTNAVISGLAGGTTYYFGVAPIDALGIEPIASDVASYTTPSAQVPQLQAQTPPDTAGVELAWNAITNEGITSYYIYYGTASGNYTYSLNAGGVTDYIVRGLVPGQTYYFAVAPIDEYGNLGPMSNQASSPAAAPPRVQIQVQGSTDAVEAVDVSWSASADPDVYGYAVDYWTPGAGYTNSMDFFYVTDGLISGLGGGTNYCFAIAPIGSMGEEAIASAQVSYTVPSPAPITLQAQAVAGSPAVELTWNALPNEGVAYYNIYYGTQSGSYSYSTSSGDATDFVVQNLYGGQTFYFVVAGVDAYGNQSPLSNEASATTAPPAPMLLQTQIYYDYTGQPFMMEINTLSAVSGPWEMDSSTDLKNWTYYASGYGSGTGDGYDVDADVYLDPTVPQMFFRVKQ